MWISQQISRAQEESAISKGRVTLNDKGNLEAVSTGVERNLEVFSPFGYCYSIPMGTDMLLNRCDGQQCAVGVTMQSDGLESGEIRITASSGAYIYLRGDGSIEMNGLIISSKGEINDNKND